MEPATAVRIDEPAARGITPAAVMAALPDFALAALFLRTWITPDPSRPGFAGYLMLVMLLEFIVVHSAAFMGTVTIAPGSPVAKTARLAGIGVFYTLFVGAFALAFHQWWPLWSFWGLIVNRMLSVLLKQPPAGEERAFVQRQWAAGALFYILAVGLTTMLPLPRLGVTPGAIAAMHLGGRGLWIDQPWRVLAAGTLYFGATAVSELFDHR
ncbi:MAG: hypothetical protein ACHQ52_10590, partial [Candidatus Eisenbacteria bacterium]